MHEASRNAARRITELEKELMARNENLRLANETLIGVQRERDQLREQLDEARAEGDRIRAELEIPDAVCRVQKFSFGFDALVVEVEGSIAGALRAAAHEADVLGRKVVSAAGHRRCGRTVAIKMELADEEGDDDDE